MYVLYASIFLAVLAKEKRHLTLFSPSYRYGSQISRIADTFGNQPLVGVWCNPGSTRDLQQLIFLSFVACRTRQVGARLYGEPSEGKR